MRAETLEEKMDLACRIAKSCFDRGMGSGTSGNLSFFHGGKLYITGSGTCLGFLAPCDFACLPPGKDTAENGVKPSKELPLHRMVYEKLPEGERENAAVIHIHSTYAVLWSCLEGLDPENCVPDHTPYLRMKMGSCGLIGYEKPGSQELFDRFRKEAGEHTGWLLAHHGLIVGGKSLMDAFGKSEELEEACKVAWMLRQAQGR